MDVTIRNSPYLGKSAFDTPGTSERRQQETDIRASPGIPFIVCSLVLTLQLVVVTISLTDPPTWTKL